MLYFASKFRRLPDGKQKRLESVGFSRLVTALGVVRSMSEVAEPGVTWLVTIRLGDGSHAPAVIGQGSGAAVMLRAGVYDLQPGDMLEPAPASAA